MCHICMIEPMFPVVSVLGSTLCSYLAIESVLSPCCSPVSSGSLSPIGFRYDNISYNQDYVFPVGNTQPSAYTA